MSIVQNVHVTISTDVIIINETLLLTLPTDIWRWYLGVRKDIWRKETALTSPKVYLKIIGRSPT